MLVAQSRLQERLLFLLLSVAMLAGELWAGTPATTTISDTVYSADGTPASGGVLLISWPSFITADGYPVGAGTTTVGIGEQGSISVGLVPNTGATPSGTFYTVVYQLEGAVRTEYWVVPTTSPAKIADVRTTLGATATVASLASRQYVDSQIATKAADVAVVHLSGSEVISGAKQFSAPPDVPAPQQPTEAANKAYVDEAVAELGAGSYVSKTGDTMSGPLNLSADPTAPSQAANRHYVDTGLVAKANVVNGVVPPSQLGNGTANGTMCLKGDSSWGACGTSSNAVSIQNVPVDPAPPTDNQVITYEASSGKYKPKAGGGVTAGMQAVKYATDFNWSQTGAADLSTPGAKTASLASCPAGVKGSESEYWIYIGGTGTAEAVKVTGGTCNGDGLAGTLQFTTANSHTVGYSISSASGGLQEAIIAARFTPTNPTGTSQSGKVIVPPGEIRAYARVSIRSSNITVDFSGSIVECYMNDSCIYLGDPGSSVTFGDITLINPRGRPMVANGVKPFIEVNAQKTRLFNVATRSAPAGNYFGTYVQVDDDQAFLLDGLDTSLGYGLRCDSTVCSPAVYAPGPFNVYSAVGWLKHLNIASQCSSNGVDWQSGNTLKISDSVIEGYAQYGVRGGTKRGGYGGIELDNVYEEVGSCANPAGNIGQAGVIGQGGRVKIGGGEAPGGTTPTFSNSGSTEYRYYVVAHHATYGVSNPLYAGNALTSGTGTITITTPDIAGASTFDLLRMPYSSSAMEQAPYGSGNYGVAVGVSRSSACANGVCTFTDTQSPLASYAVGTPTYFPLIDYWPGSLVLGTNGDSNSVGNAAWAMVDDAPANVVAVHGLTAPAVIAQRCGALSYWTPTWVSCHTSLAPGTYWEQGAFILAVKPNTDANSKLNLKGRMNFSTLGSGPGHIITLSDSNFQKTIAVEGNRPTNDVNDAYVGYDQGNGDATQIGISLGAPKSISSYIGNNGDGTNWLERLTASGKTFKTNVTINGSLTVSGACNGCGGGGGGGGAVTSVFGRTGAVAAQSGDYTASQITGAENTANKGAANGYAGLDGGGKVALGQIPSIPESQIGGLSNDLAAKMGSTGPQTFSGDLTVTGSVTANSFTSTGAGPWSVEGSYGAMTAAGTGKSKIGFDANGRLSVSESAGPVTEVAKKLAQEFSYTFFDANNPLSMGLQVPSIYVNRAAAFRLLEVYCEVDTGSASINLQTSGANLLSSDLACSTSGATTSSFATGKDGIALGQKINHVTVSLGTGLHRMNVVVKYVVD